MQEYLPIIKATLLEWAQLALANPLFTASLIIATALLLVIIGMIKNIPLKRRAAASEKARVELANNLLLAQQQAAGLQERLVQRNQQVADTVQAVAAGLNLGEQPLPVISEDLVSEDLWQQHDRIIAQLADRLRAEQQAKAELQQSCQAETGKRIEKEAIIDSLQNTLAEKTLQISGLQQQAAEILEKHVAQSARFAELEQQSLEWLGTKKHYEQLEAKLAEKESELSQLQAQAEARKEAESLRPQAHAEPVAEAEPIQFSAQPEPIREAEPVQAEISPEPVKEPELIQAPFPAATDQAVRLSPPPIEEEIGAQVPHQAIVLPDWDYQPEVPVPFPAEAQKVASGKDSGSGLAGKFKGLFGKSKPEPAVTAEKSAESAPAVQKSQPTTMPEEQPSAGFAQSQIGKVTSLFTKAKHNPEAKEAEAAKAAEPEKVNPPSLSESDGAGGSAKSQIKKLKNLFSNTK
ncbi:MAG: hypothetical protein ACR65R_05975 [Methylomicrobium sp.]